MAYPATIKISIGLVCVIISVKLAAQEVDYLPETSFKAKHFKQAWLPFGSVEILDSRTDTSLLYINETGYYPVVTTSFASGTMKNVQHYMDAALAQVPHGDKHLLIRLNQFRVLNRSYIRRTAGIWNRGGSSHERMLLDADLYYRQDNGKFMPIARLVQQVRISNESWYLLYAVGRSLNNIIKAACLWEHRGTASKKRDSLWCQFVYDSSSLDIAAISSSASNRRKSAAILATHLKGNAIFETFHDCRNATPGKGSIVLDTISRDSVYRFSFPGRTGQGAHIPYAVLYNDSLYVNVFNKTYLRVKQESDRLVFYVPHILPDMYSLLSFENFRLNNHSSSATGPNLLLTLLSVAVTAAFDALDEHSADKRMMREGLQHNFRYCLIDIDNGDFLYADHKW